MRSIRRRQIRRFSSRDRRTGRIEVELPDGRYQRSEKEDTMFQHILVPLDGSLRAEQAVPVAARIARATGGSVLLLEVVSMPIDYSGGMAPGALMARKQIESDMATASDYLKEIAASPLLAGIETNTKVAFGSPALYIIGAAEVSDQVVLCSHGRTGFTRWALGSVAHTLVHQSTAPILVLRQSEAPSPLLNRETGRPLRALVPLDGSPLAETALRPAAHLIAALAAPAGAALHLVQVVKVSPAAAQEGMASAQNEDALRHAKTYLASPVERLQASEKDLKLSITSAAVMGEDVVDALRGPAEQEGLGTCDLIAISTHGRAGLQRWRMGSVTERLLDTTKLPMLIVRPRKKE